MTGPSSTQERQARRIRDLAREYRRSGYTVVVEPEPADLPAFLWGFRPDMIARNGAESVVFEVKSRKDLAGSKDLADLAARVNTQPNWRFELVVTNPRPSRTSPQGVLDPPDIENRLSTAQILSRQNGSGSEAALMLAWSSFEAAMRLAAARERIDVDNLNERDMVKHLSTLGVLDRDDYAVLESAATARNSIAHGFKSNQVDSSVVDKVSEITGRLLEELRAHVSA